MNWRIRPSTFLVAADGPTTMSFLVSHGDAVSHRATVTLGAPERQRGWFTLEQPTRDCPPGATVEFVVAIRPDLSTPATVELTATVAGFTGETVVVTVKEHTPWALTAAPSELLLTFGWGPAPITLTAAGPFGRRVRLAARTFTVDHEFDPLGEPYEDPGYLTALDIPQPDRTLPARPETFTVTVLPGAQSGIAQPPEFVRFELLDADDPAAAVVAAAGLNIIEDLSGPELL